MRGIKNRSIGWWMGIILSVLLLMGIGIFGYIKMNFLVKGIVIKTEIIRDEDPSLIEIKGNAMNAIHLKINGREIFIDKKGNFSEMVYLLPGLSILSLNAVDQFGKLTNKEMRFVSKGTFPTKSKVVETPKEII